MPRSDTARLHTIEAGFPWALPPVSRVYLTPRARVRRARNRFLASPMARDIHAGLRNRFLPGIGALGCLFVGLLVFRGLLVAADMAGLVTP